MRGQPLCLVNHLAQGPEHLAITQLVLSGISYLRLNQYLEQRHDISILGFLDLGITHLCLFCCDHKPASLSFAVLLGPLLSA